MSTIKTPIRTINGHTLIDETARQGVVDNAKSIESLTQEIVKIPEPYTLPIASADTLGGVKVGEGLTMSKDGVLSATYDSIEVAWENAYPSTGFPEQTIQIDLADAKAVCMLVRNSNTGSYYLSFGPFPKGIECAIERNVETSVYVRKFIASNDGVKFRNADSAGAAYLIPIIIWKLK